MTFFESLLELAMYEYEFLEFLKLKIDLIEIKLTQLTTTTEISDFLEDIYQYFKENI